MGGGDCMCVYLSVCGGRCMCVYLSVCVGGSVCLHVHVFLTRNSIDYVCVNFSMGIPLYTGLPDMVILTW